MRRPVMLRLAALVACALAAGSSTGLAQTTRMGLHGGLNLDRGDVFIGLNGHIGVAIADIPFIAAITAELYPFLDRMSVTVVELDGLLPGRVFGAEVYVGGGVAMRSARYDVARDSGLDDSDTNLGLNAKLGIVLGDEYSGFRPFMEVDRTFGAGSDFSLRAGVFFTLGAG